MAVPHPEDEMTRLRRMCAKGLPSAVLVTGSNDFFRNEAIDLLLAAVPKEAELRRIDAVDDRGGRGGGADDAVDDDGGEQEVGEVEAGAAAAVGVQDVPELLDLRSGGLFAKSSFLCVRRGNKWWQRCAVVLAAELARFGKGCGLLLEAAKLDKRKKVAATLVKDLTEAGAVFEFRDLYESPFGRNNPLEGELTKWVGRRAQQLGVPLTAEAAWLLVMQVGRALPDVVAELGRLRDQFGPSQAQRPLGPEDLRGRLTCSFESTPFELAEAVLARDRRRALRSLRAMFDRGVRSKEGQRDTGGVFPFATSWLWRSLSRAYEGRRLLATGVSPRELPKRLGVFQFAERFVEQVQQNDLPQLRRGLLALHHCARQLRRSGEAPDVLLEQFLSQWFDGAPIPTAEDLEL